MLDVFMVMLTVSPAVSGLAAVVLGWLTHRGRCYTCALRYSTFSPISLRGTRSTPPSRTFRFSTTATRLPTRA